MECIERMEAYLRENGVPFEVLTHAQAFTMAEVAAALHVPGGQVAKVVMVKGDGEMAMLVVSTAHRLDFDRVRTVLSVEDVRLAKEEEFGDLFPDCEIGAMPPFGHLYDVPVYVDQALADAADIIFRVGTHQHTMEIAYADYARLVAPTVAEFALHL